MGASSEEASTDVSIKHLQASNYPLMRRLDQQFALETKFSDYQKEISRVSGMNKAALASIDYQERRVREMQASLRSSSSNQTSVPDTNSIIHPEQKNVDQSGIVRGKNRSIRHHQRSGLNTIAGKSEQRTPVQNIAKANLGRPIVAENVFSPPSITVGTLTKTNQINCVPDVPMNLCATDIRHDSFALSWDTTASTNQTDHDKTIFDYEINYNCSVEETEQEVLLGCSRWCLKGEFIHCSFRFITHRVDTNNSMGPHLLHTRTDAKGKICCSESRTQL